MTEVQKAVMHWITTHPWKRCEECCQGVKTDLGITWQEANNAHLYLRRARLIKKRGVGYKTRWALTGAS